MGRPFAYQTSSSTEHKYISYKTVSPFTAMPLAVDLLNPSLASEKAKHKKRRLVQSPNSYFLDVMCPAQSCSTITTVFSHPASVTICRKCKTVVGVPTGGAVTLTTGARFRKKTTRKK